MKEPPIVGIYRNCTDIKWCCEDCKHDNCESNEYPCRMCVGDCFNAFEPKEGWESMSDYEIGKNTGYDFNNPTTSTGVSYSSTSNPPKMQGWICPVCGRGLSPFTSVCPCKNGKGWEITC